MLIRYWCLDALESQLTAFQAVALKYWIGTASHGSGDHSNPKMPGLIFEGDWKTTTKPFPIFHTKSFAVTLS